MFEETIPLPTVRRVQAVAQRFWRLLLRLEIGVVVLLLYAGASAPRELVIGFIFGTAFVSLVALAAAALLVPAPESVFPRTTRIGHDGVSVTMPTCVWRAPLAECAWAEGKTSWDFMGEYFGREPDADAILVTMPNRYVIACGRNDAARQAFQAILARHHVRPSNDHAALAGFAKCSAAVVVIGPVAWLLGGYIGTVASRLTGQIAWRAPVQISTVFLTLLSVGGFVWPKGIVGAVGLVRWLGLFAFVGLVVGEASGGAVPMAISAGIYSVAGFCAWASIRASWAVRRLQGL